MAGGYHTRRQRERDRALVDRVGDTCDATEAERMDDADEADGTGAGRDPPRPPAPPAAAPPRACWVGPIDRPHPGHVLRWHRDEGTWWALVLVTLPPEAVTPRAPGPAE